MKKIILLLGTMLLLAGSVIAQIEGDVVDQKDKGVPNALVTATDTARKVTDTVRSDERGFYSFKGLKSGKYKIEAKAVGFLPAVYYVKVNAAPDGANEGDDTYYAETLDIILTRPKVPK